MTNRMLQAALGYAQLGIRVIPIKPGMKYPPINEWQNQATTNPDTITEWWTDTYHGYGIGIATGRTTNGHIFVLDVDDRDEYKGSDTLHDLEQTYGQLPETVEATTGTGGRHLYYYSPTEIRNNAGTRLGKGLDIRGEGGQVLADPTLHPNGRPYTWNIGQSPHDRKPAHAPQWLIQLLTKQPEPIKPPTTPDTFLNDPTTPSARYNAETTWEQLLIPDGWTLVKTDRHGEQHWTRPGKDPREGTSATIGHNGNDALIVFTSAIPWLPEGGYNRFGYYAARHHNGDWKQAAHTYLQTQPTQPNQPPTQTTPDELHNMLINWHDFWQGEHTTEDWIAKPLIARGRQTALFAGAKTGKSWITLNIIAALATGKPILGQPAQPPVHTLYLDYEMTQADLMERLEQFGYTEDDDYSHLHYALIPSLPPLNTYEGATALTKLCELTKAQVVIIDTTGRAIEGEEDKADSYRAFARTTGLALKKAGIALVRTDHAGKKVGQGQRGSSAKNDDVDIVYRLDKTDEGVRLVRTHSRISWCPEKVDLIVEDFNDIITIRYKAPSNRGFTIQAIDLARRLDQLGYPTDLGVNETIKLAKEQGITLGRKTLVSEAIRCRKQPKPDPLEVVPVNSREPVGTTPKTGTTWEPLREPLGNHLLEPSVHKGTTPPPYRGVVVPMPQNSGEENLSNWEPPTPNHDPNDEVVPDHLDPLW